MSKCSSPSGVIIDQQYMRLVELIVPGAGLAVGLREGPAMNQCCGMRMSTPADFFPTGVSS